MVKNAENLNNERTPEMELAALELETAPWMHDLIDSLFEEKDSKIATPQEIQVLRQHNILGSNNKVCVRDIAEELLDFNYNADDDSSWKNLWNNPRYVANVQSALSIFWENCSINGTYDNDTKAAITNLIRRYKNKPNFNLNSDGSVPITMKNVLANALMFPKKDKGTEIISKDKIPYDTSKVLKYTTWDPQNWKIRTLKKWGKYYS